MLLLLGWAAVALLPPGLALCEASLDKTHYFASPCLPSLPDPHIPTVIQSWHHGRCGSTPVLSILLVCLRQQDPLTSFTRF